MCCVNKLRMRVMIMTSMMNRKYRGIIGRERNTVVK